MPVAPSLKIDRRSGAVTVAAPQLGQDAPWPSTREFVSRLSGLDGVDTVLIDRRRSTATIQWRTTGIPAADGLTARLRRLADRMRQTADVRHAVSDGYADCQRFTLRSVAARIVGGVVRHTVGGRVRLWHPLVRKNPQVAHVVEAALLRQPGVFAIRTSPRTGSVLVRYDERVISQDRLLAVLERAVAHPQEPWLGLEGVRATRILASAACMTVAIASDFFVPGMAPLAAAVLVGCNLPVMIKGLRELATFRWQLPALYTVIMGTTLIGGQFLAAALMHASVTGWYWWSTRRLNRLAQRMLTVAGSDQRLLSSSVPASNALSADPERQRMQVSLEKMRHTRVRTVLKSALSGLSATAGPTQRAKTTAGRFVPLSMITGGLAYIAGDVSTMAAVLRPDFSTGPSLAERFSCISSMTRLLEHGWLVQSPDVPARMANVDTVVLVTLGADEGPQRDYDVGLRRHVYGSDCGKINIMELSGDPVECVLEIHRLVAAGRKIAVAAPQSLLTELADANVLRISTTPDDSLTRDDADVVAIHGQTEGLAGACTALRAMHRPHFASWVAVGGCNVLAIAGALAIGLTSLHVVIITNLGSIAAVAFSARQLQQSGQALSRRLSEAEDADEDWLDDAEPVLPVVELEATPDDGVLEMTLEHESDRDVAVSKVESSRGLLLTAAR